MFCPNCQREVNDNYAMCPLCGTRLVQNNFSQKNESNPMYNNPPPNPAYNKPNQSPMYNDTQLIDPGESTATVAFVCGILSLFLGIIPAIIAIVFSNKYAKEGNGNNESKVKAGKTMAIVSIVLFIVYIIAVIAYMGFFISLAAASGALYEPMLEFSTDIASNAMMMGGIGSVLLAGI